MEPMSWNPYSMQCSPCGEYVAIIQVTEIEIWSLSSKILIKKLTGNVQYKIQNFCYSWDGNEIVAMTMQYILVWDVTLSRLIHRISPIQFFRNIPIICSPINKQFLICLAEQIEIYDLENINQIFILPMKFKDIVGSCYSSNGKNIIVSTKQSNKIIIHVIDLISGMSIANIESNKCNVLNLIGGPSYHGDLIPELERCIGLGSITATTATISTPTAATISTPT